MSLCCAGAVAACSSAPEGLDPPAPPGGQQLASTSFHAAAGQDAYMCYQFYSPETAVAITHVESISEQGVHHVALFQIAPGDEEPDAAHECDTTIKPGWQPVFVSAFGASDLALPDGVGIVIAAHTQYVLQVHIQNSTDGALKTDPREIDEVAIDRRTILGKRGELFGDLAMRHRTFAIAQGSEHGDALQRRSKADAADRVAKLVVIHDARNELPARRDHRVIERIRSVLADDVTEAVRVEVSLRLRGKRHERRQARDVGGRYAVEIERHLSRVGLVGGERAGRLFRCGARSGSGVPSPNVVASGLVASVPRSSGVVFVLAPAHAAM